MRKTQYELQALLRAMLSVATRSAPNLPSPEAVAMSLWYVRPLVRKWVLRRISDENCRLRLRSETGDRIRTRVTSRTLRCLQGRRS